MSSQQILKVSKKILETKISESVQRILDENHQRRLDNVVYIGIQKRLPFDRYHPFAGAASELSEVLKDFRITRRLLPAMRRRVVVYFVPPEKVDTFEDGDGSRERSELIRKLDYAHARQKLEEKRK